MPKKKSNHILIIKIKNESFFETNYVLLGRTSITRHCNTFHKISIRSDTNMWSFRHVFFALKTPLSAYK